ncbi:MAG: urea carboxylase-associated protein [Candidatus Meridianibacter frigidus]|nr:MAG: urea carboxylase-associated protein [Candidatus Eremiobacteraeota bacterium]
MPVQPLIRIPAQSAAGFTLRPGDLLEVVDSQGGQVADLTAFGSHGARERFSSGRTLDYNEHIYLTTGARLYSNRSNVMFTIVNDAVGRHDYLLSPCSRAMFELLHATPNHPGCLENLARALEPFGICEDDILCTFNIFMNVDADAKGRIILHPPRSKAGDATTLRAEMELIVGLSACASEHSNAGANKPIDYCIITQNTAAPQQRERSQKTSERAGSTR